jgi:WD40 repeat protein
MALSCVNVHKNASCVAFSPHVQDVNRPCLAVGQRNGDIALWTHAALRKGERCTDTLQDHDETVPISSMAFSSNGELLASGSKTIRLWDTQTKKSVAVLRGHVGFVSSVVFSPDNLLLASAANDGYVQLWDVVMRKAASPKHQLQSRRYADTTHNPWKVSFSPDGRKLASAGTPDVQLWNMPEGTPGPVLHHDRFFVWCVAFSPVVGSNMVATCDNWDSQIKLWDVSEINAQLLRVLQGLDSTHIAFSPDGSQLVSGSWDATVRLSSVASGKLLKTLTGHSANVRSVAFHPNGKQVASCSDDNTVRIWTVCEWSDRTHQLFGNEMKRLVFCLMCVRDKLELETAESLVPKLPMALWLEIFEYVNNNKK